MESIIRFLRECTNLNALRGGVYKNDLHKIDLISTKWISLILYLHEYSRQTLDRRNDQIPEKVFRILALVRVSSSRLLCSSSLCIDSSPKCVSKIGDRRRFRKLSPLRCSLLVESIQLRLSKYVNCGSLLEVELNVHQYENRSL